MSTICISYRAQSDRFQFAWITLRPGWVVSNTETHEGRSLHDLARVLYMFVLEFEYFDIETIVMLDSDRIWNDVCSALEMCEFYDFLYTQEEYNICDVPQNVVPLGCGIEEECEFIAEWYVIEQLERGTQDTI